MAYCVKCGKPYEDGAAFCPGCGVALRPGATAPAATPPMTSAPAAPPAKRGPFSLQRPMIVAIVAIVVVAAVVIAGFTFLGPTGMSGKVLVAFARHYEGTWVDQQTGDKAIIDTTGGIARISIIAGSDGHQVTTVTVNRNNISVTDSSGDEVANATIDGDNIAVDLDGGSERMSLNKDVFIFKNPSSGETHTFVRH